MKITPGQTAAFLSKVSAIDNRIVTPEMLSVWHEYLADVDVTLEEADSALTKVRQQFPPETYLVPAHIIRIVSHRREQYALRNPADPGTKHLVWVHKQGYRDPNAGVIGA